ncbi:MAG: flagellar FliJ family protein, partial [Sedimentisphaerales bacterium]|nr:flagellar FliJ family protein [Sedimentisphaerales bacterium]
AAAFTDEKIKELKKQIEDHEAQRKILMAEVLELRRTRKSLEKLRAIAKEQYEIDVKKFEQNHLDDISSIAFARTMFADTLAAAQTD